jgi:hypothetical protein
VVDGVGRRTPTFPNLSGPLVVTGGAEARLTLKVVTDDNDRNRLAVSSTSWLLGGHGRMSPAELKAEMPVNRQKYLVAGWVLAGGEKRQSGAAHGRDWR